MSSLIFDGLHVVLVIGWCVVIWRYEGLDSLRAWKGLFCIAAGCFLITMLIWGWSLHNAGNSFWGPVWLIVYGAPAIRAGAPINRHDLQSRHLL